MADVQKTKDTPTPQSLLGPSRLEIRMANIRPFAFAAVAIVSGAMVAVGLRKRGSHRRGSRLDVGRVSEGWLLEQRGREDS